MDLSLLPADLGRTARGFFTTRAGGVSQGPWESLNLGGAVGDVPDAVARNRADVGERAGAPVAFMNQVHGSDVAVLTGVALERAVAQVDASPDAPVTIADADALVTDSPRLALAVLVADCVPVLLADAELGVVGAAHVGRRGLVGGVLAATIEAMTSLGARPAFVRAAIGPAVCGRCYEVPPELREEVDSVLPGTASVTSWGTPALDLPEGAARQLTELGVTSLHSLGLCTRTDHRFFSYRRAEVTGRFAGVVRVNPE